MGETSPSLQSEEKTERPPLRARPNLATLVLRPSVPEDEPFLLAVYASTRADEMKLTGWTSLQQESFLRMQFEAQKSSYAMQYPHARCSVIEVDGKRGGRLIVERSAEQLMLVDLALLPEFRQQGIGSLLMAQLMQEARASYKAIRLHVERFSPALQWYERLGFANVDESPIYLEMLWRPRRDFERFRELVWQDESLQKKLRDIEDPQDFISMVESLGKDLRYQLTSDDVKAAMQDGRRAWVERWVR
jgi:ribosomal protein S18 acetylase RimI-like enzyme